MITQTKLKELLHYDPDTGVFTWISPTSNRVSIGDVAGTINWKGYLVVGLENARFRLHRLAFLYMTGEHPSDQVDHINGDKSDNRWLNLRIASNSQNHMNVGLQSNNTSGEKGVVFHKPSGKWVARVKVQGKLHSLGCYDDKDAAIIVVRAARKRLHGDFNRI